MWRFSVESLKNVCQPVRVNFTAFLLTWWQTQHDNWLVVDLVHCQFPAFPVVLRFKLLQPVWSSLKKTLILLADVVVTDAEKGVTGTSTLFRTSESSGLASRIWSFFTWYIFTNLSLTPVATSLQHHFLLTCLPGVMSLCYLRDLLQNSLRKHILPCLSALLHVGCIFGSHGYQVIFHVKTVWLADFWWNLASRLHGTWDMTFSYNISYYKGVLLYTYSAYNCISVRECRIWLLYPTACLLCSYRIYGSLTVPHANCLPNPQSVLYHNTKILS